MQEKYSFNSFGVNAKEVGMSGWFVRLVVVFAVLAVAATLCGCKDKDKPVILVDITPPTTSATPPGGHYPALVSVTLVATDDFDADPDMFYTVDGVTTPTSVSSQYDVATPIDIATTTTLQWIAVDSWHNETTVHSETYVIDNQAPVLAITDPATDGDYMRGTYAFEFTVTDPGDSFVAHVYYQLNGTGGTWLEAAYSGASDIWTCDIDTTALTDGSNAIYAYAEDEATNASSPVSRDFLVDNTDPTCNITTPAGSPIVMGTLGIDGTAADAAPGTLDTVEVRIEDSGGTPVLDWTDVTGSSPWYDWDTTAVANGDYTVFARATDEAGNTCTPDSESVTVDNDAPTTTFVNPSASVWITGASYTIQLDCTDTGAAGVANVYYQFDGTGGAWTEATYNGGTGYYEDTIDTNTLSDGSHDIYVYSIDAVGNTETAHFISFSVDNEVPICSIDNPASDGLWLTGIRAIAVSATDLYSGVANVYIQIDATGWVAMTDAGGGLYTYDWNTTSATPGSHDIFVYVQDNVGLNNQSAPVQRSCNVDNDQPVIGNVPIPAENEWVNGNPYTVIVNGVGDGSGSGISDVLISFGGAASVSATDLGGGIFSYDWNTTAETDGPIAIEVTAFDNVGLASSVFTRNCSVDNTIPTCGITTPTAAQKVAGTVPVQGTAADNLALDYVEIRITEVGFGVIVPWTTVSGTTSWVYNWDASGATDTDHLIEVISYDLAGNASTTATVTVEVANAAAPDVAITSHVDSDRVYGDPVAVSGTSAPKGAALIDTVEYQIDSTTGGWTTATDTSGGTWATWTFDWDSTSVSNGSHTIYVRATDDTPLSTIDAVEVIVDHAPPTTTINAPTPSLWLKGNSLVDLTVVENLGGTVNEVWVKVDSDAAEAATFDTGNHWTFDLDTTGYSDGAHVIKCWGVDDFGNSEESGGPMVSVMFDNTDPTSTCTFPADAQWVNSTPVLTVTGTCGDGTGSGVDAVWVNPNGTGWTQAAIMGGNSWSFDWNDPPEGTGITISFYAVDNVGNIEISDSHTFNIDYTPPTSWADPVGDIYITPQSVDLDASDNLGTFDIWYTDDGSDPKTSGTRQLYSSSIDVSVSTTLKFYAVDQAGNEEDVNTEDYIIGDPPMFVGAAPGDSWTNMRTGTNIYLLFANEPMDRTSVETNFTVTKQAGGSVSGTWYWRIRASDSVEIGIFVPDDYLDDNSLYDCDFTSLPTSDVGIELIGFPPGGFTFETTDCTAPQVINRDPDVDEVVASPASKRNLRAQLSEEISQCFVWLEPVVGEEDIFDGDTWHPALSIIGASTDTLVLDFDMLYDEQGVEDVNDDSEQLNWWWLQNAEKGANTDADGKLYVVLSFGAGTYTVSVYKDPTPADLVAEGSTMNPQGYIELSERNLSGLQGGVELDYSGDDSDIELVIPFFEIEPGQGYIVGLAAWDNSWNMVQDEWVFYGQGNAETDPPEVIDSLPAASASGISPRRLIYLILSESIDPSTFSAGDLTIVDDTGSTTYQYRIEGNMIALYPDRALTGSVAVTLAADSVDDLAPTPNSGPSSDFILNFTAATDTTDPTISWVLPASGTIDIDTYDFAGGVLFSERMSDQLPTDALIVVEADSGAPIKGIELRPRSVFDTDVGGCAVMGIQTTPKYAGLLYGDEAATFELTLSADIADISGNTLGTAYTWPVTTVANWEDDKTPVVGGEWAFDENIWAEIYANGNGFFEFYTQVRDDFTQEWYYYLKLGDGNDSQVTWATTLANVPVVPENIWFTAGLLVAWDDGWGKIAGDATGSIDYITGDLSITWNSAPGSSDEVAVNYYMKGSVCFEVIGTGDGSATQLSGTLSTTPVSVESLNLRTYDTGDGEMTASADWEGQIYGDVDDSEDNYINYETGEYEIFWRNPVKNGEDVLAFYETGIDVTVSNGFSTWTLLPTSWGEYMYETFEDEEGGIPGGLVSDPQWEGNENYGWNRFTFTLIDKGAHTVTFYKDVYIPDPASEPGPVPTYPDTCDGLTDTTPTFTWDAHSVPMEGIFTYMWLGRMLEEDEPEDIGEWIFGSATSFTLPDNLALSPDLYMWVTVGETESPGGDCVSVMGVNNLFEKSFWIVDTSLGSITGTMTPDSGVTENEPVLAALFDAWPPDEPLVSLLAKYNSGSGNWTYAVYNLPSGSYYVIGLMELVEPMGPNSGDVAGAYPSIMSPAPVVIDTSGTKDYPNTDFTLYEIP